VDPAAAADGSDDDDGDEGEPGAAGKLGVIPWVRKDWMYYRLYAMSDDMH
jgi:hypothetical protein